jgi:hypothetical protein
MLAEKVALLEFEEVRQEYAVEDALGIPMSVRERYERALAEIRERIREARQGKSGKRLGEKWQDGFLLGKRSSQRARDVFVWQEGTLGGVVSSKPVTTPLKLQNRCVSVACERLIP